MITYELIKKRKAPASPLFEKVQNILHLRRPQQQQQPGSHEQYMGKLEYANWVEELKKEIRKGDLMTLSQLMPKTGEPPIPVFTVIDIQEIHWNAPIGPVHGQPRAVVCFSKVAPEITINYEPKVLRHLTKEEIDLVNLRDHQNAVLQQGGTVTWSPQQNAFVLYYKNGQLIKEYSGS